jgi:hypothetical protein
MFHTQGMYNVFWPTFFKFKMLKTITIFHTLTTYQEEPK